MSVWPLSKPQKVALIITSHPAQDSEEVEQESLIKWEHLGNGGRLP